MIICGGWFFVEKQKTKAQPNTEFRPIFNGRNNDKIKN